MLNEMRRKAANVISPEKSKSYPLVELNWASPQSENRRALERAHVKFAEEFGRTGTNEEVWKWYREEVNRIMREAGIEPSNPCTEYKLELFYEL